MCFKIELDNAKNFSLVNWEKVKSETNEYLQKLCSKKYELLANSIVPKELIKPFNINNNNFRIIKKVSNESLDYFPIDNHYVTGELITLINNQVSRILNFFYLEVLHELINKANKENIINQIEPTEINSLTDQKGKDMIKKFLHSLIKQKSLKQASNFENLNKEWIILVNPNVIWNLTKYGKHLIKVEKQSNKFHKTNYIYHDIRFIEEPRLGIKNSLIKNGYDFSKIACIFFSKKAFLIKYQPIHVLFNFINSYIDVALKAKFFIKIISDSTYLLVN